MPALDMTHWSEEKPCLDFQGSDGAGGGNRTPHLPIGFDRSTIKLHRPITLLMLASSLSDIKRISYILHR